MLRPKIPKKKLLIPVQTASPLITIKKKNRIAVARRDYNDAVKTYNLSIKQFPNSILAGMFGFDTATYFEASESSKDVTNVSFE